MNNRQYQGKPGAGVCSPVPLSCTGRNAAATEVPHPPGVPPRRRGKRALPVCVLWLVFTAVLGGCSLAPSQGEAPPLPVFQVQPGTWRAIDEQIYNASVRARNEAGAYARVAMDEWLWRVRQRATAVFIPWYTGYWTQQWITVKVSWYKLQQDEGETTPEERLVSYLQEQFYTQVLEPVSSFVDPYSVMEDATLSYLRDLKDALAPLPARYRIPVAAFSRHLEAIPAIAGTGVPPTDASLHEVLQAADLSDVAGYEALLAQIAAVHGSDTPGPSADRLQAVARRAVNKLLGTLTVRGGAAAASTLAGGFWGMLISTGSAVWGALEHENDRPVMEAQLRENLDAAMGVMWQDLVEDEQGGVMAMVHHMSTQIEAAVFRPMQEPLSPYVLDPSALF
jgi:hypothetical protein